MLSVEIDQRQSVQLKSVLYRITREIISYNDVTKRFHLK